MRMSRDVLMLVVVNQWGKHKACCIMTCQQSRQFSALTRNRGVHVNRGGRIQTITIPNHIHVLKKVNKSSHTMMD